MFRLFRLIVFWFFLRLKLFLAYINWSQSRRLFKRVLFQLLWFKHFSFRKIPKMDLRKHMLSNTIRHLIISKIVPIAPSNGLLITRDSIILSKVKKCQVIYVEMNPMHSVNHAHVSLSSVNYLIMSVRRVGAHQQRHLRPAHQLKHTRWKASFTFLLWVQAYHYIFGQYFFIKWGASFRWSRSLYCPL